jgi:hypothetical protein
MENRGSSLLLCLSHIHPFSKERLVILGSGWAGYKLIAGIDKVRLFPS